jgi:D-serine deaminase-like pyridoxal phosphate-dependent protein
MQYEIGSCDIRDIALVMACPIVDKYPSREELIIHGGAIHFSKESINVTSYHYGLLAEAKHDTWTIFNEKSYLKALSQEHGIISCPSNMLDDFEIGDLLFIFPVHSCLTANLMGSYTLQNGKIIKQYN